MSESNRARVCPLLDNSGHCWILARDGLSANDPSATWRAVHERGLQSAYPRTPFGRAG